MEGVWQTHVFSLLVIVEKPQVVGTLRNQDKEESQITFARLIFPSEFPLAFSLLLLQKEALARVSRDIEVIKRSGVLHSPGWFGPNGCLTVCPQPPPPGLPSCSFSPCPAALFLQVLHPLAAPFLQALHPPCSPLLQALHTPCSPLPAGSSPLVSTLVDLLMLSGVGEPWNSFFYLHWLGIHLEVC